MSKIKMKLMQAALGIFLALLVPAFSPAVSCAEENSLGEAKSAPSEAFEGQVTITLTFPFFSPLFSNTPLALVNEEPILLKELKREMESFHLGVTQETPEARKAESSVEGNYLELLDRLINIRLIVEEARNIGLDELPRIQEAVEEFSKKTLRSLLFRRHLDESELELPEEEVEEVYREYVREVRLSSLFFKNKEDADRVAEEVRSGEADFDSLAEKLKEEGLAEGTEKGGDFVKQRDLLPNVAKVVRGLEVGSVSPAVRAGGTDFTVFKLEEVRYPDDPEAREQARQQVMARVRRKALEDYITSLQEKYTEIDEQLLESVDFDAAEPGFDALLSDKRVVATIEGDEPFTVGDLAAALKEEFFHGVERAIGKLNEKKMPLLLETLQKRSLMKEALSLGIDRTEEYQEKVSNYEQGMLFGAFIDKVVAPDVKLTNEEVEEYYAEHRDDYTTPKMLRLESLVFTSLNHAEDAAVKLREGTDFKWLLRNAEGQVDKDPEELMDFAGRFWMLGGLPDGVKKAVADANKGDIRIYESPEGDFYVLLVMDVRAEEIRPFDEVKLDIANQLHGEKLAAAVKGWAEELRKAYEVVIFVRIDK